MRVKFLWLVSLLICGCSLYEYEVDKGWHTWEYVSLQNDSIAVVKVTYHEYGHIHDHHLISWEDGESFEKTISEYYYPVNRLSYWIGKRASSAEDLLKSDGPESIPKWADSCLAVGTLNKKTYCVDLVKLDDSGACALTIRTEKSMKDSLEFIGCRDLNDKGKVQFASNYLKVGSSFYGVVDGKFPSQSPAFWVVHEDKNVKFENRNGDYLIYGGMP